MCVSTWPQSYKFPSLCFATWSRSARCRLTGAEGDTGAYWRISARSCTQTCGWRMEEVPKCSPPSAAAEAAACANTSQLGQLLWTGTGLNGQPEEISGSSSRRGHLTFNFRVTPLKGVRVSERVCVCVFAWVEMEPSSIQLHMNLQIISFAASLDYQSFLKLTVFWGINDHDTYNWMMHWYLCQ